MMMLNMKHESFIAQPGNAIFMLLPFDFLNSRNFRYICCKEVSNFIDGIISTPKTNFRLYSDSKNVMAHISEDERKAVTTFH